MQRVNSIGDLFLFFSGDLLSILDQEIAMWWDAITIVP